MTSIFDTIARIYEFLPLGGRLGGGFVLYFLLLLALSTWAARRQSARSNAGFFLASSRAPWPLVAMGMIAGSISGVSFISVPGWAASTSMTYLQMCAGYIVGYVIVAFVLLPLYYRLRLTSIYAYLGQRYGPTTHRTGAAFFMLSKLTGATARLYLATLVLHTFVAAPFGIPYVATVAITLLLIWAYTARAGHAALLYTDALQTLMLLLALGGIIFYALRALNLDLAGAWNVIVESPMSRVFDWDWGSRPAFWRPFLSGIFIVIVMTGLDQDMMQKNLTCRSLRDAQKEMCVYGLAFLPINALFLGLGILLYHLCAVQGIAPPAKGDQLLPMLIEGGWLGAGVLLPFSLGIVAAAFSAADGAFTALTTSVCVDLFDRPNDVRLRRRVHAAIFALSLLCVLVFHFVSTGNTINTIFVLASYTYGPLLGLYAYGLYTRRAVADRLVPIVAIAAPIVCALLDWLQPGGYQFGYELLLLNGLLTAAGLWLLRSGNTKIETDRKKVENSLP